MDDKILVFEDLRDESVVEYRRRKWDEVGREAEPPTNAQFQVRAYVSTGRWVVACPNLGCAGAEFASKEDPTFLCVTCGSRENNGNLYEVVFPGDVESIEAILMRRPAQKPNEAASRNWWPWETVDDLIKENVEHGLD